MTGEATRIHNALTRLNGLFLYLHDELEEMHLAMSAVNDTSIHTQAFRTHANVALENLAEAYKEVVTAYVKADKKEEYYEFARSIKSI
jgi:hypothetical protein